MFGHSRARVAVVAAVVASVAAPGAAYALATPTTTKPTTTTTIGGPRIPSPSDGSTTTVPSTGPTTTTTIPGPPPEMPAFTLPTSVGIELLKTMQQAKTDLTAAQGGLGPAEAGVGAGSSTRWGRVAIGAPPATAGGGAGR